MSVTALSTEEASALDSGVRDLVIALRSAGYETTDSGDGVSKPQVDGCTLPFLHVYVRVPRPQFVWFFTNELYDWLQSNGHEDLTVEASYVPGEPAFCMVRKKLGWDDVEAGKERADVRSV